MDEWHGNKVSINNNILTSATKSNQINVIPTTHISYQVIIVIPTTITPSIVVIQKKN